MTVMQRLRALWRTLTGGRALDRDLDAELDAYVDLVADEAIAHGASPADARRRALAAMGGRAPVAEAVRAHRTGAWLLEAGRDGRHGLRILRRAPAFAASAILTLALAIGTTAAMTAAVGAIVVAPLPYQEPDRLIQVAGHGYTGEYLELVRRAQTFDPAVFAALRPQTLVGFGAPVRLETVATSHEFFAVLGVTPALGSAWRPEDSQPGAEPAVLISHRLWRQRFGGDPFIVGRTIALDGVARRVRGVMPASFAFPDASTDVWIPATIDPADRIALWSRTGLIIGRLTAGRTVAEAHAEVRALSPTFAALFPWRMPPGYGENAAVQSLTEATVGDPSLFVAALAAVGVVFAIACLNVGILLVGRTVSRRVELATRAALGASRLRLVRQVMAECALLSGLGGAGGLLVGVLATRAFVVLLPPDAPRLHEVGVDLWLVAAVAVLTIVAGLTVSVAPVVRAARRRAEPLRTTRGSVGDRRARAITRTLVAVEVALAAALVVGAALFTRSLDRLLAVDPGFEPAGLTAATIAAPPHRFTTPAARRDLFETILARVRVRPGVAGVALTDRPPFAGEPWGSVFTIEGRPDPATVSGEWPWADVRAIVNADYFDTMRTPVTAGRPFGPGDTTTSERVAIVNAALARAYWPDDSPIGRRVRFPGMTGDQWLSVVGTVADSKWRDLGEAPLGAIYLPLSQAASDIMTLLVRSSGDVDPDAVGADVRTIVSSVDDQTPVDRIARVDTLVGASAGRSRFLAVLFGGFAVVGVLVGVVGIYGVTSDGVARRRHEVAVRIALGAGAAAVVGLMVRQTAVLAVIGVAGGLFAALGAARLFGNLLYGVSATDPVTFTTAAVTLVAAAALAAWIPARRAARVDPLEALRDG